MTGVPLRSGLDAVAVKISESVGKQGRRTHRVAYVGRLPLHRIRRQAATSFERGIHSTGGKWVLQNSSGGFVDIAPISAKVT